MRETIIFNYAAVCYIANGGTFLYGFLQNLFYGVPLPAGVKAGGVAFAPHKNDAFFKKAKAKKHP